MGKNNHKRRLTNARDILLRIADNPHNLKFRSLPSHEVLRAKSFRSENKAKRQKFMRYKRGTVVFVHFGINVGSEFSNSHFGIVLDKDDHPSQGKLTILPLTSKKGKSNVSIDKEIFSGIMNDTEKHVQEIQKLIGITTDIEFLHHVSPQPPAYISPTEEHDNYSLWIEFFNRHDPEHQHVPAENTIVRKWIQSDIDKVNHLKKLYDNYNKVSYAKIDSITSVSKLKIAKPINDLDPVGKIKLSQKVMDKIDQAIAKKLLSGPWKKH